MDAMGTLIAAGLTICADGGRLIVTPASALTDPLRNLIRGHKAELLALAAESEALASQVIAAINRACDARCDGSKFRAELLAECAQLTPRLQADAIEHFDAEAEIWKRANRGEA